MRKKNVNETQASQGYNSVGMIHYLTRLAQYQSNSFERLLMRKLSLTKSSQLRDYVIPRGDKLKQAYIRWDALVCLFNEFLIPRNDKGQPLFIVTDRIYDTDNGNSKIDPLLYCPISDYSKVGENNVYDFSCDANVCILPHQFGEVQREGNVNVDVLGLDNVFGYKPNLSVFATDYLLSIYKKERTHYYNDIPVTFGGGTLLSGGRKSESELKPSDRYRRIGSIFLNVNMLTEIAENNEDNKDYTLGQYINDIWKKVNKACPNHNFVLTDDKESNTLFIIDLPVDNSELPTDFHEFIPFSNKNILRSFDYTSNVPSALSSTIAIQSQSPRSIRDIDGVTFAAFNKAIKNRLFSTDTTSDIEKTKLQLQSEQSRIMSRQQQLRFALLQYQQTFFKNIKLSDTDKTLIGEGNITGQLKEYQKNASYMSISFTGTNSFNSVIPLEFNATLDGISGMVIGNIFKVQKDRLPIAYKNSNVGFILFNEEQKVTAGGDWTTDISGKMTVLPDKKISIKGVSITIPAKDEAILNQPPAAVTEKTTTEDMLEGQNLRTDIGEAVLNSVVYLKAMKDNSPTRPTRIGTSMNDKNVTDQDSIGFAFVRWQPYVNNERGFYADNYNDNALGAFDSWNKLGEESKFGSKGWATQPLGVIVAVDPNDPNYIPGREDPDSENQHLEYPQGEGKCIAHHRNNRIQVLPQFYDFYFEPKYSNYPPNSDEYVFFTYDKDATYHFNQTMNSEWYAIKIATSTTSTSGGYTSFKGGPADYSKGFNGEYKFVDGLHEFKKGGFSYYLIAKEHATTQAHIWYNIQFTKEASDVFNNGWTLGQVRARARGGDFKYAYIDTDGADDPLTTSLEEYSKTNNCWMHHSVLATSQESAAQLFVNIDPEFDVQKWEEERVAAEERDDAEKYITNYLTYSIYRLPGKYASEFGLTVGDDEYFFFTKKALLVKGPIDISGASEKILNLGEDEELNEPVTAYSEQAIKDLIHRSVYDE